MSHKKTILLSIESWLFNRDPHNGYYNPDTQVFFKSSCRGSPIGLKKALVGPMDLPRSSSSKSLGGFHSPIWRIVKLDRISPKFGVKINIANYHLVVHVDKFNPIWEGVDLFRPIFRLRFARLGLERGFQDNKPSKNWWPFFLMGRKVFKKYTIKALWIQPIFETYLLDVNNPPTLKKNRQDAVWRRGNTDWLTTKHNKTRSIQKPYREDSGGLE